MSENQTKAWNQESYWKLEKLSHSFNLSFTLSQHVEIFLFSCLCSKVTVYSQKLQCFFWTSASASSSLFTYNSMQCYPRIYTLRGNFDKRFSNIGSQRLYFNAKSIVFGWQCLKIFEKLSRSGHEFVLYCILSTYLYFTGLKSLFYIPEYYTSISSTF